MKSNKDLQHLTEKLGGNYFIQGRIARCYLNKGVNNSLTKTVVYIDIINGKYNIVVQITNGIIPDDLKKRIIKKLTESITKEISLCQN
jgi:hypothetical protein